MTDNDANGRAGRHTRWLVLLVAATSLSGCMASALDTSAIEIPDAGQTFAYADEGAGDAPRPPEYLITGSTDTSTQAVPITPPAAPAANMAAAIESPADDLSRNSPDSAVAAVEPTNGNQPDPIDPATARIYSASGQPGAPAPRPPISGLAKRTGSLLALFSNNRSSNANALVPPAPLVDNDSQAEMWNSPSGQNASGNRPVIASASVSGLPGVDRDRALGLKSETADDDDMEGGPIRLASAAGLARLAPNGLKTQTESVDVACLKPALVRVLKKVEQHYGRDVIVTSGYRNPNRNKKASGSSNSLHMYCSAADIQLQGVTKMQLAAYLRSMPGRGGVGTYCHTESVHIDIGPERDWNWRCRRKN